MPAPGLVTTHPIPQLIGEEEDVSVYDIADHPDFRFRTTDIVIRIGNTEDGAPHKEDEVWLPARLGGLSLLRLPPAPPPVQPLQSLEVPPGGSRRSDLQVPWAPHLPRGPSPGGLPDRLPKGSPAGRDRASHSCSLSPGGSI